MIHMACGLLVRPWWSGPFLVLCGVLAIAALSVVAWFAVMAVQSLPPRLSRSLLFPSTIWHESCHLLACLVSGHRVTGVRFTTDHATGRPPHVDFRYNPARLRQRAGVTLVGLAPVLFSFLAILWIAPNVLSSTGLPRIGWSLAGLVVVLAMPLSALDWGCVGRGLLTIVLWSLPLGWLAFPHGLPLCLPWRTLHAGLLEGLTLVGVFGLGTLGLATALLVPYFLARHRQRVLERRFEKASREERNPTDHS